MPRPVLHAPKTRQPLYHMSYLPHCTMLAPGRDSDEISVAARCCRIRPSQSTHIQYSRPPYAPMLARTFTLAALCFWATSAAAAPAGGSPDIAARDRPLERRDCGLLGSQCGNSCISAMDNCCISFAPEGQGEPVHLPYSYPSPIALPKRVRVRGVRHTSAPRLRTRQRTYSSHRVSAPGVGVGVASAGWFQPP